MMKISKIAAAFFALIGVGLAALTVYAALNNLQAEPVMLKTSDSAVGCAETMLDRICAGDYAGAGQCMYGKPALTTGADSESETGRMIWAAFVDSLSYELVGDSYITDGGIAQDIRIRSLDISSVTKNLKDRSQALLTARVAEAEDVTEIYDSENNYREDFVMEILRQATAQAIREDARYTQQELTLNLVYEQDQWWVVPSQALLNAISGGILG